MARKPSRQFDPDTPIDAAVSSADEEMAFALSTPPAPDLVPQSGSRADNLVPDRRPPGAVLNDHLQLRAVHDYETDLPRNFAPDLVVIDRDGCHRGYHGIRSLAAKLQRELPDARFTYRTKVVDGRVGFLEWSAESPSGAYVDDGAVSYLIEHGRIVAQAIDYTVKHPPTERRACHDPEPAQ